MLEKIRHIQYQRSPTGEISFQLAVMLLLTLDFNNIQTGSLQIPLQSRYRVHIATGYDSPLRHETNPRVALSMLSFAVH